MIETIAAYITLIDAVARLGVYAKRTVTEKLQRSSERLQKHVLPELSEGDAAIVEETVRDVLNCEGLGDEADSIVADMRVLSDVLEPVLDAITRVQGGFDVREDKTFYSGLFKRLLDRAYAILKKEFVFDCRSLYCERFIPASWDHKFGPDRDRVYGKGNRLLPLRNLGLSLRRTQFWPILGESWMLRNGSFHWSDCNEIVVLRAGSVSAGESGEKIRASRCIARVIVKGGHVALWRFKHFPVYRKVYSEVGGDLVAVDFECLARGLLRDLLVNVGEARAMQRQRDNANDRAQAVARQRALMSLGRLTEWSRQKTGEGTDG